MNGAQFAEWEKLFPGLSGVLVECPACTSDDLNPYVETTTDVKQTVMHLNDFHRMSREDIADWLDSLNLDLQISEEASFKLSWFERGIIRFNDSRLLVPVAFAIVTGCVVIMIYRLTRG